MFYCDLPVFNIPRIPIHDSPLLKKISHYTYDLLPDTIYVSSENSGINFNSLFQYLPIHYNTSGTTAMVFIMIRDRYECDKLKMF